MGIYDIPHVEARVKLLKEKRVVAMIGHKYGKWEVMAIIKTSPEDIWEVICDCGEIRMHTKGTITSGNSTQCRGCHYNVRRVPDEVY